MAHVEVDITAIKELQKDLQLMTEVALRRLGEQGYILLREEIKKTAYVTGNLWQGVTSPNLTSEGKATGNFSSGVVTLTVTARSAKRGARTATLHLKNGKTKQITLKPTEPYNYADVVARGNKSPIVRAKSGKVFLIPVNSAPSNENYISDGSQIYVVRKSRKGRKPNPFDERAAEKLQKEAPAIILGVVDDFK